MKRFVCFSVISLLLTLVACSTAPEKFDLGKAKVEIGMGYGFYEGIIDVPKGFPYGGQIQLTVKNNNATATCRALVGHSSIDKNRRIISFDLADLAIPLFGESTQSRVEEIAFNSEKWEARR